MRRLILALAVLLIAAPASAADDLKVTARAEPDHLPPGEAFRLIVTVEGEGIQSLPEPKVPRLKNFEIVGQSTSQQVSIVNLSMKVMKNTVYQVIAPKEGTFTIPPIELSAKGKTYKTEPLTIKVDPQAPVPKGPRTARRRPRSLFPDLGGMFDGDPFQSGRKLAKDDLIATMEVDKTEAVPFEQITATFSFMRAVDLWEEPGFSKPDFEGFWVEELPWPGGKREKTDQEVINGKRYVVTKIRYALFPLSEGTKVVDSASVTARMDPWSRRARVSTNPIPIEIIPAPEDGRPDNFSNMVGNYTAAPELSTDRTRVGESVALKIKITGSGYLKPVTVPPRPVVDGVEIFDPKVTDTVEKDDGVVYSTRIVEYPMIPREEGEKTIPSISLSWYDPKEKAYKEFKTPQVKIEVAPSISAGPTPPEAADRGEVAQLKGDIRYIKPDRDVLDDWGSPPHRRWWIWLIILIPAPGLVVSWRYAKNRERLRGDTAYARRIQAARTARERLEEAGNKENAREFFAALDHALRGYLADRWNIPAPSVTKELINTKMAGNGGGLRDGIIELLEAVEAARYAPSSAEDRAVRLKKAEEIIETLERKA